MHFDTLSHTRELFEDLHNRDGQEGQQQQEDSGQYQDDQPSRGKGQQRSLNTAQWIQANALIPKKRKSYANELNQWMASQQNLLQSSPRTVRSRDLRQSGLNGLGINRALRMRQHRL